jgi:uncharacterized protein YukE|tara:strand:- start:2 stop:2236 length:2235 start_codon:yes stop_codon:yes gene_type:complete
MATPQEIQKQLERIAKLYDQLGEKNPFAGADASTISQSEAEVKKLSDSLNGVTNKIKEINADVEGLVGAFKATVDEISNTKSGLVDSRKIFKELTSVAEKLQQDQAGITELNQKDVEVLRQKFDTNKGLLEQAATSLNNQIDELLTKDKLTAAEGRKLDLAEKSLNAVIAQKDEQGSLLDTLDEELKKREEIEEATGKNMGVAGKSLGGIQGVLDKVGGGKFGKMLGIDDAMKAGTKEAKRLSDVKVGGKAGGIGNQFKVAGKMIGTMGKALSKALGPIAIIAELVKGMMQADEQTKELGRSMMMTKNESRKFSSNISAATRSNYQMGITGTKVLENITKVNKQFGHITEFSGETLVSMTKLTYTLKIGEEAAGNLAAAAEATGVNFEDNYKNILAASYELQQQAGTQVDMRAVLEDTGKVTGQIRANFGGNTVEIAKAVTNARLLGTEMGTIAAAGKQLLDFESSITAEMEAELLTGRNLNLERARAAALTGDQVTLQNELAREMGSFSDFSKLNVIQQEALAGAMGMSVDSMSDMLFNQETMGKSAKELRDLGKDELANRLEQKSAQDKMNSAMAELKQVFVDLGTALSPILNLLSVAAGIVSTIVGYTQDLLGFINPFSDSFGKVDFEASQGNNALKGLGKSVGIEDGVIGPGGDLITTSPEDFLIATKDPGEMLNNTTISEGNNKNTPNNPSTQLVQSVDTSKMEKLLESALNRKQSTPVIKMNDVKLGTAVDMGAYSIQ